MTNDERSPNVRTTKELRREFGSCFGFRHSFGILYSCFVILLNFIPDCIHLRKINVTESLAARAQFVLQSIETGDKFISRSLQCAFRIQVAFSGEIDGREEQITYFVLDQL